jgi:hypothetical protein
LVYCQFTEQYKHVRIITEIQNMKDNCMHTKSKLQIWFLYISVLKVSTVITNHMEQSTLWQVQSCSVSKKNSLIFMGTANFLPCSHEPHSNSSCNAYLPLTDKKHSHT